MKKTEEQNNKEIMKTMWFFGITSAVFYLGIVYLAIYTLKEGPILGAIICSATVLFIIVCFYLVKLEVSAGYYECKNCHERFVPTYFDALMAPHIHTTRYLRCPKCDQKSWSKKVMTKE